MKPSLAAALLLVGLCTAAPPAPGTALIDPTLPKGATPAAAPTGGWLLTATRITPQRRMAVINGTDVVEGTVIGAARVVRIGHAEVVLETHGERMTLHLSPAKVKTAR